MKDEGAPKSASPTSPPPIVHSALDVLRDVFSRLVRVEEAYSVGDGELVALALPDLVADVWASLERLERAAQRHAA